MDNLTHTLTAVVLSRAGLNRYSRHATLILVASSNFPDVDAITSLGGSLEYLSYHRHVTHAIPFSPLTAALCAGLLVALARWSPGVRRISGMRFLPALLLSLFGVLTHILLDLLNNYGVRIWLPFDSGWTSLDVFMVIEPWLTIALLLCLAAPALSRLVGGEIGSPPSAPASSKYLPAGSGRPRSTPEKTWAIAGLLFFVAWAGLRFTNHARAVEVLNSRTYQGRVAQRTAAWPTPWNPFHWRGYVSTDEFLTLPDIQLLQPFDPESGPVYSKPAGSPEFTAARGTATAQAYLRFAQFPVWRTMPALGPDSPATVTANDVRFGLPEDERFHLTVKIGADLRPQSARFSFGNPMRGMGLIRR